MSCWRKYQCDVLKNVDKDLLKKACKEMGFELDESVKKVSNMYGKADVDCAFVKNGVTQSLGFVFDKHADGKVGVTVSGDFWSTGFNELKFVDQLSQVYQKHNMVNALEASGYTIETVETNAQGEIEIEAYAWA